MDDKRIAELRGYKDRGMVSAVGEYTPDELWEALDALEKERSNYRELLLAYHDVCVVSSQRGAALDAEQERCAKLRQLLQAAEVLFSPLCRDATAMSWCDEARAALAELGGPNVGVEPRHEG